MLIIVTCIELAITKLTNKVCACMYLYLYNNYSEEGPCARGVLI